MEIQKILRTTTFDYTFIHTDKPISTREDGAKYFGIDIAQTAPTLIIKTDKGFFGLILSGRREKINFDDIAQILNCRKAKLASPEEVRKTTGYSPGSVPLIGFHLPCLIDKRLFRFDFVYGGTGLSTCTLKIPPKALSELNSTAAFID